MNSSVFSELSRNFSKLTGTFCSLRLGIVRIWSEQDLAFLSRLLIEAGSYWSLTRKTQRDVFLVILFRIWSDTSLNVLTTLGSCCIKKTMASKTLIVFSGKLVVSRISFSMSLMIVLLGVLQISPLGFGRAQWTGPSSYSTISLMLSLLLNHHKSRKHLITRLYSDCFFVNLHILPYS